MKVRGWLVLGAVTALVCVAGALRAEEGGEAGAAKATPPAGEQKPAGRPWDMPYAPAAPPQADDVFHLPTGLKLPVEGMMEMLAGARVVYVGETHDNLHAHRVELAVIRELARRFPGKVAIGMEMFREPQQEALDRWLRGELTEFEFLKASKWYESWGSDFGYYRDILQFARDAKLDVIALNPPKELEAEVSKSGLDQLPEAMRARLPEMGPPDPYQRESLKAVFGAHKATEGVIDSFLRIQALWEESMAGRAADYLRGPRGEGKRLVVLAGGWHVRYGFGIPKKLLRRLPVSYAIVLPTELSIPEEKQDQVMEYDLPEIPLLPGDFLWMVPYEDLEKDRVRLGVKLSSEPGPVKIEGVEEGYPAEKAGIEKGSEFVSFDGRPVADVTDVQLLVRAKRPGDTATLVLRRDGAERTFVVELFRVEPKKAPAHGKK